MVRKTEGGGRERMVRKTKEGGGGGGGRRGRHKETKGWRGQEGKRCWKASGEERS